MGLRSLCDEQRLYRRVTLKTPSLLEVSVEPLECNYTLHVAIGLPLTEFCDGMRTAYHVE